jgi:uncharacterized membrane protein
VSQKGNGKPRLHLIDEYRGFVLINMIAYHAIWDLVYIFGVNWKWYKSDIGFYWQQWICWSFILISGFCWQMGRHPLKRGLLVYSGGVIISAVTLIAMPDSRVMFGILTLLGSSMLLMIPLELLCRKIQPVIGGICSFWLFLITYPVNSGYLGIGRERIIQLPNGWYANGITTYFGFMESGFYSTDYFSIIPWFFLFVTGYFLYRVLFQRTPKCGIENCPLVLGLQKSICPVLGWLGRRSLIIYMLHQPVVYAFLYLIFKK